MVIGAVIALEMVIGSVGVPRAAPVIEQTQDDFRQLPLINRETPPSLETDAPVNDREQLRRYFLQGYRARSTDAIFSSVVGRAAPSESGHKRAPMRRAAARSTG